MTGSPQKAARFEPIHRHIARLDRRLEDLQAADQRFFWLRLGVLAGGGFALFVAFLSGIDWLVQAVLGLGILLFAVVIFFHRRLDHSLKRFRITRRLAAERVARMQLDWAHLPPPAEFERPSSPNGSGASALESTVEPDSGEPAGAELLPPEARTNGAQPDGIHPFAGDLNLTGNRSLHRLLDTAISQGGSRRLHQWLLAPVPDPAQVLARQALVRSLVSRPGFRNHLALYGALVSEESGERWDGEALLAWLAKWSRQKSFAPLLLLLGGLAVVTALLFLLNLVTPLGPWWMLSFTVYAFIYLSRYSQFGDLFNDAQHLGATLDKFRTVLVFLEKYPYPQGTPLAELAAPFWQPSQRPSATLRHISRIASALSLRGNPFVWVALNAAVPWDVYFGLRLQQVKEQLQEALPVWLERWYELEALTSLANFAFLNPDYSFPELVPVEQAASPATQPVFSAQALGHPLIPDSDRVANDFTFQELGEIVLITGSNMSGKSTFLRTLGINLVLTFAGAPVCAGALRTIPFRLFTSINVSDSLSDGISYFYAEVRRLKALLVERDRPHPFPQFFLIDEIFRGTNNRERQIGSHAYVQALAGSRGVGAISTHDLELTHLAKEIPAIRNQHFREDVLEDRLVFDYRLRPGPCPTTNALKIMALEGLPVQIEQP